MAALYRLGEATTAEVVTALADHDAFDSIRVTLGVLEKKGHVTHRSDGVRHLYRPVVARRKAGRTAAKGLIRAFFHESPSEAVLTLLDLADRKLTPEELDVIAARIDDARRGKG